MRAINVMLSILVSLLVGALVLEGGLRLIGKAPPKSLNRFDRHAGWAKEAGRKVVRSTPEYKITIETNEFGLREDQGAAKLKAPGVFRVLALGDSFTLGYSVERADSFVEQLERWWKAEGRNVEVINAGTEGYSTDQAVAWLAANGAEWSPDLVLLFPYDNDWYWNGQETYIGGLAKPVFEATGALEQRELAPWPKRSLLMNSALARFFGYGKPRDVAAHMYQPAGAKRALLKEFAAVLPVSPDVTQIDKFELQSRQGTQGALKALQAAVARLGVKAVVVPIPSHSAVDDEFKLKFCQKFLGVDPAQFLPERPFEHVIAIAKEIGLPTLDARAALRQAGAGSYYDIDWHFTPKGNGVFASFLREQLDSQGFLPPEQAAKQALAQLPVTPAAKSSGIPFWAKLFAGLWLALSTIYCVTYPKENRALAPLKVGAMLGLVFGIFMGGKFLIGALPPAYARLILPLFLLAVLSFVAYKLGRRLGTIAELIKAFTLRGHWYLMPLVMVLLSVGSLLVVAASSPLIAPFIYTLF